MTILLDTLSTTLEIHRRLTDSIAQSIRIMLMIVMTSKSLNSQTSCLSAPDPAAMGADSVGLDSLSVESAGPVACA